MRFFIAPGDYICNFRLRDFGQYLGLNLKLQQKILRHFGRILTRQRRTYRVRSQISSEILASTDSLETAKIVAHQEGLITWGKKRSPRRYVTNEDGLVVYAPSIWINEMEKALKQ